MANNKLTLKVTKLAFYNGALVYPNEIIKNFKGDKVPSWATLAGGKEIKPEEKADCRQSANGGSGELSTESTFNADKQATPVEPQNPVNPEEKKEDAAPEQKEAPEENTPEVDVPVIPEAEKSEVELLNELEALLNESVEKGIVLENSENKTLVEQIAELKVLLGK